MVIYLKRQAICRQLYEALEGWEACKPILKDLLFWRVSCKASLALAGRKLLLKLSALVEIARFAPEKRICLGAMLRLKKAKKN